MSAAGVAVPAAARVHLARVRTRQVPAGEDWLTPAERAVAASLRLPGRLASWRLGRWAAKQALIACASSVGIEVGPRDVEVLAQPGGAPAARITLATGPVNGAVSISHRDGTGLAVASLDEVAIGCDVETIERRSDAFVADYFTASEQALVTRSTPVERDAVIMLIWSAKESALKALGEGLRLDTRAVSVVAGFGRDTASAQHIPVTVHAPAGRTFTGWARIDAEQLMTIVADRPLQVLRLECAISHTPHEASLTHPSAYPHS